VAQALALTYGANRPASTTFSIMLPVEARDPLTDARNNAAGLVDKTIAELQFGFWRKILTSRFDNHIWAKHLRTVFPHLNPGIQIGPMRLAIYKQLSDVKKLRDRIAHHKAIFMLPLGHDFQTSSRIIGWRCASTLAWMAESEAVWARSVAQASQPCGT
jgi:hypothetical protein